MLSLKECRKLVDDMAKDGFEAIIFKTPDGAPCNQYPANIYNTGRYMTCLSSERADYEAGGAVFVK